MVKLVLTVTIYVTLNWFEELKRLVPVELMPINPGTTLGPYEVIAKIGEMTA
ncbi:MAG: hypothetical protein O7I93_08005 [Gemmatimonadetes bacterium]|nr:hypothetical protein [Gemmatimonadota bacterium]